MNTHIPAFNGVYSKLVFGEKRDEGKIHIELYVMITLFKQQQLPTATNFTRWVFKMVVTLLTKQISANGSAHHLPPNHPANCMYLVLEIKGKKKIEPVIPPHKSLWSNERTDNWDSVHQRPWWRWDHWASWRKNAFNGYSRMSRRAPCGERKGIPGRGNRSGRGEVVWFEQGNRAFRLR